MTLLFDPHAYRQARPRLGAPPVEVVAVWIIVLVVGVATMATVGGQFDLEEFRADFESLIADDLITERLSGGIEDPAQEFVIVSSAELTVDDPAFQAVVDDVAAEISSHDELVSASPPTTTAARRNWCRSIATALSSSPPWPAIPRTPSPRSPCWQRSTDCISPRPALRC